MLLCPKPSALTLLHAAQQGFVSLHKTLEQYLNDHPNSYLGKWANLAGVYNDSPDKRIAKTKILRLLTHSAGINKGGIGVQREPISSLSDVLDGSYDGSAVGYLADAGSIYSYSGGGYAIAESILDIETTNGATNWLNGTISAIGMSHSTFGSLASRVDKMARLHDTRGDVFFYRECPVKTAGGLFATASDYAIFLRTLLNQGKAPNGRQLLATNWNSVMFRPMYREGSSLKAFQNISDCSGFESCVRNTCMRPIRSGKAFIGPDIRMLPPFDPVTKLPEIIEHSGAQLSTRTKFLLNIKKRQGIVIFVSGPTKWKNDPDSANEAEKGAGKLLAEILKSYSDRVGW